MALAVIAFSAAVPAAQAQPGWTLPPASLSAAAPLGWPPVVASDAAGDATALYATASGYSAGAESLFSADQPAGGAWKAPVGIASGGNATGVALASDPAGDMTAAWVDHTGSGPYQVWTATRAHGANWSTPTRFSLTGAITDTLGAPGVAEDPQGDAVVTWTESNRQHTATWLLAARRHASVWSAPTQLSDSGAPVYDEGPARVSVDAEGDFVAVWSQFTAPNVISVDAQELIGGVWQGEQTLESGGDRMYSVALDENALGEAAAIWADRQKEAVHAATLSNGSWTLSNPPATHLFATCQAPAPSVAVDGAGNTLAAWTQEPGQVVVQSLSAAGVWDGTAQTVSAVPSGDHASDPQISVDAGGDALVTWTYHDTTTNSELTQAAWRPAGGSWATPVTISGPDGYDTAPSLSLDSQGNAVEAWASSSDNQSYVMRAANFGAAPVVQSVQLPLRATQHQTASFSAAMIVPWATFASAHWDFGDGTGADGASVSHAYARPGSYTVILTVSDGLLNHATVSRQITVTASPQPYAGSAPGAVSAPGGTNTPAVTGTTTSAQSLTPVYLVIHKQRLWLARGARTVSTTIHNTNGAAVTGTATIYETAVTSQSGSGTPASPHALSAMVRFKLAAHASARLHFRLGQTALKHLRAQLPDDGQDLVQVRLTIGGSSGQTASGAGVYALDGPSLKSSTRPTSAGLQPASEPQAREAC